ncbi:hypothetical protein KEJ47_01795 [Candidatus Bathyarchaeota archaeon]|nr:hypothetical protein [Candidatus Bathyarchaeota archaeon]
MSRPIVFYHVYTSIKYNEIVNSRKDNLKIALQTRNSGASKTYLWLVIDFYNLTLIDPKGIEVLVKNGVSRIFIPWLSQPSKLGYESYDIEFSFLDNSSYSLILFSVYENNQYDFLSRFHNSFAVYIPERPTALIFKNIDGFTFIRLQKK